MTSNGSRANWLIFLALGLIMGGVALVNSWLGGQVVLSRGRHRMAESARPD